MYVCMYVCMYTRAAIIGESCCVTQPFCPICMFVLCKCCYIFK